MTSRAPYGARGLKFDNADRLVGDEGRAPYGARGLKSGSIGKDRGAARVAPRMGRVD